MTVEELAKLFNEKFAFNNWPKNYVVDADTYANICNHIFSNKLGKHTGSIYEQKQGPVFCLLEIAVGADYNGIMFKNVELILNK